MIITENYIFDIVESLNRSLYCEFNRRSGFNTSNVGLGQ